MKMTTEQFLSHLGIEVGKEFMWDEYKMKIDYPNSTLYKWFDGVGWVRSILEIGDLLDEEITPLPKYTLTEEDKNFISAMRTFDKNCFFLGVDGNVELRNQHGVHIFTLYKDSNLLRCVQQPGKVSLDELRKCL